MRALLIIAVLAFVVIPAVEIATFVHVGARLGALPTVLLTLLTAVLGVMLVRVQGLMALADVERAMARGRAPLAEMLGGALLLLAGVLLLIPGFVTDALGFVLLVPPLRRGLAALVARLLFRGPGGSGRPGSGGSNGGGRIIEVEVVEVRDGASGDSPPARLPRQE